ncbi:MAG: hypothetical protein Q8O89_07150 [Nanoarchaeota archaeon]|nr:hypothetical protein [Nanoarchaeota archaeon]
MKLEEKIAEIVEKEFPGNYFLGGAMDVFDQSVSPFIKAPPRQRRMELFLDEYKKNSCKSAKNLFYIGKPADSRQLDLESNIAKRDYLHFFKEAVEDYTHMTLPGYNGRFDIYFMHGEIYRDANHIGILNRLFNIKQLGLLNSEVVIAGFNQTRYLHSLSTALLTELCLTRNGFSEKEINLGIISGLLHDVYSSPLSDQGKLASRRELDEEKIAGKRLIKSKEIIEYAEKYGVSIEEVIKTIQGKNTIGQLINSKGLDLDTVSYVLIDFEKAKTLLHELTGTDLSYLSRSFDLHKGINFLNGEFVYSNPSKVSDMLYLRALLFSNIYRHPNNRAKEAFFEKELKHVWGKSLNIEKMMRFSDQSFQEFMLNNKNVCNPEVARDLFELTANDHFSEIVQEHDISKFNKMKQKYEDKNTIVAIHNSFNPKTTTKVIKDGKVCQIRELMPEYCGIIEGMSEMLNFVGVYKYLPNGQDKQQFYMDL